MKTKANTFIRARRQGSTPLAVAVLVLMSGIAGTPSAAQSLHRGAIIDRIDSLAARYVGGGFLAGVSVAVAQGPGFLLAKGYGYASLEHRVPATAQTVYRIGSITKQFTAAAIMRLVEQGRLTVNDEVTKFFRDYPTGGRPFTVHQMLTHTAGVKNYTELGLSDSTFRLDLTHDRMIGVFKDQPTDFAPGENWSYSNSPYFLAGVIVEKLSGKSYAEYLDDTFFEPLGMTSSSYCDQQAVVPHQADVYAQGGNGLSRASHISMTVPYAAGALCSTVLDLVTWQRALNGQLAVSAKSWRQMTTPARLNDGWETSYGYGLVVGEIDGLRLVGHGGQIDGGSAMLLYYPDHDLIVAAATNTNPAAGPPFFVLAFDIARAVLGLGPRQLTNRPLTETQLAKYTGKFISPAVGIELSASDGRLMLGGMAPQPIPLRHQGNGVFLTDLNPLLRLEFDGSGWRGSLGGLTYRFVRQR